MTQASRTFRIFVSSTFSDLKAERNALQEKVFPRLRDLATAHGCRFQAIDLRWGVSEEAALDQQTMKICLGEIERCQKTKLKPNFIILLGDRYGWRPLPYEIPADEFEKIVPEISQEEKTLLERWFRRDDNATPAAVFVLQPRLAEIGSVPNSEFSGLLSYLDSKPSRKLERGIVEQWYQQKESKGIDSSQYFETMPLESCFYVLRPVPDEDSTEERKEYSKATGIVEQYFWSGTETRAGIEARLHGILEKATRDFPNDTRLKYTASATEQEIEQGALQVDDANKHVFGFFRSIDNLRNLEVDLPKDEKKSGTAPRARDFIDTLDDQITRDVKAHESLDALEKRLKEKQPGKDNIYSYSVHWNGSGISQDHIGNLPHPPDPDGHADPFDSENPLDDCLKLLEKTDLPHTLCNDVWRELSRVILSEAVPLEAKAKDTLINEITAHEDFGKDRARVFIGRTDLLKAIGDYIAGNDPHPLAIWGVSGSGKSALMAKAVEQAQKNGQDVLYRFIGATPESSNGRALLESLCRQISRRYGADESNIPSEFKDLVQEFPKRLALATPEKPLVIFLDALDQLSDTDNARSLIWLPAELPPNVRLIVSTLRGDCLQALESKLPAGNRLEVQPMSVEEGKNILTEWLSGVNRQLEKKQEEHLLGKFQQCGLPLYLKLAFEEARLWKSYEALPELSGDIPGILRDLFKRLSLESNHGGMLVSRSLGYLAAAKNGLSEDELLDVLSLDKEMLADFQRRSPKSPKVERLPVVIWSRLYFDLEPYLTERSADGTSLFAFYHRQMSEAVTAQYLAGKDGPVRHSVLADYFKLKADPEHNRTWTGGSIRGLSELPFQFNWPGPIDWTTCTRRSPTSSSFSTRSPR